MKKKLRTASLKQNLLFLIKKECSYFHFILFIHSLLTVEKIEKKSVYN